MSILETILSAAVVMIGCAMTVQSITIRGLFRDIEELMADVFALEIRIALLRKEKARD